MRNGVDPWRELGHRCAWRWLSTPPPPPPAVGVERDGIVKEVEAPQAGPSEVLVQVEVISLNRGEVLRAMHAEAGWRPGWDLAGTVIKQAAHGTGPKVGSRVVGMVDAGA